MAVTVICSECGRECDLAADGDRVSILKLEGWTFTSVTGWLCPEHARAVER